MIIMNENATSKVRTVWHWGDNGEIIEQKQQIVDDVIDANASAMAQQSGQRWGNQKLISRLPNTIYFDLMKKGIAPHQDEKAFDKWLRQPENRAFVAFDRVLL